MDLLTIGYDQSGAGFIAMRARLITDKRKVLIDSRFEAKGASASSLGGTILQLKARLKLSLMTLAQQYQTLHKTNQKQLKTPSRGLF